MTSLQSLYADAIFRLSGLDWLEGLDLLLVTVTFFLLLNLLQRSRAGFLLRGALALSAVLLVITIILPLPAFDWLMRASLIALLVGTPIIFQPELRRSLERLGHNTSLGRAVRQTEVEKVLSGLGQTVGNLSRNKTGALIVLEGNVSLREVVKTGVPFEGWVSSELLQSIFYPGTPLHDGAVVIRDGRVVAAGCVLPITQNPLDTERRLGTRHRAAVGLSEVCDALVIVVSEETGEVSVARHSQLKRPLSNTTLREQILNFYTPPESETSGSKLGHLGGQTRWRFGQLHVLQWLPSYVGLLLVSLLLALAAWSFAIEQINPARRYRIDNIPLKVVDLPTNMTMMTPPPTTVSAIVQTTSDVGLTLRPGSFQAIVSLSGLSPGLYHSSVQVNSGASQVRVLSVDPPALDLELAPVISQTLPVTVDLPDQQNLSPAYKIVGEAVALPQQVQVMGAAPLVEQVSKIQATVSLANAGAPLQETRPIRALDGEGREVIGVSLEPAQVQVTVPIRQRANARDVGVRVIPGAPPPAGYWLSRLSVAPASITLQGSPDQLAQINGFVDTVPIDLSQAYGDLEVQVPLDLPTDIQALDNNTGDVVRAVTVQAQIAARSGDMVTTRPVEPLGAISGVTITISPPQVELLLSGPLPTLRQIETTSDLIRVGVDVSNLTPGESVNLTPNVFAPDGVKAQLMPPSVLVTMSPSPYALQNK
jgi:diadenylate cyclase